jgi:Zinc-binding dehydrogenase
VPAWTRCSPSSPKAIEPSQRSRGWRIRDLATSVHVVSQARGLKKPTNDLVERCAPHHTAIVVQNHMGKPYACLMLGESDTGVCSTRNIDFVRSLGADEVLDYTRVDAPPSGVRYAFVLDSVGRLKFSRLKDACIRALAPGGRYVSIDDGDLELSSKRLEQLKGLIESGTVSPIVGAVSRSTTSSKRTELSVTDTSAVRSRSRSGSCRLGDRP